MTLLTPRGRGAVATIRVSGPGALALVGQKFLPNSSRDLNLASDTSIVFGRWDHASGEEVVVRPISRERVEIHCHGGMAASRGLIESLVAASCEETTDSDSFVPAGECPLSRAAACAMIQAPTDRSAGILWDQAAGALAEAVMHAKHLIAANDLSAARELIEMLLANADVGQHLVQPWQIVIAGAPNVGKSSLVNAMLGFERSIVCETPGSTRDAVVSPAAIDGWPVELIDTAGLRESADRLESVGMELAERRIGSADLVILVFDASVPWTAGDEALAARYPAALGGYNKIDLKLGGPWSPPSGGPAGPCISATQGTGIADLLSQVSRRLVPRPPQEGEPVPFTASQAVLLVETLSRLLDGRLKESAALLDRLLAGG